ncbi:MAG: peptidoglycan editing factor PgeF [Nostocoides sp.]
MWWWHEQVGAIECGFTDRDDGVSAQTYAGLNLGGHVGDDEHAVAANRSLLREALTSAGAPAPVLASMSQVHGRDVAIISGTEREPPVADAMVTDQAGVALMVLVADCTPVLLHDEAAGLIGVAHAGRAGLVRGIVPAAVAAMRDLGSSDLRAVVGPSICGRCYEVPAPMRDDIAADAPASYAVSWQGTPAVDVAAGVTQQLGELGVALTWVAGCSRESPQLFSYRRDGVTGRFAGVVVRQ